MYIMHKLLYIDYYDHQYSDVLGNGRQVNTCFSGSYLNFRATYTHAHVHTSYKGATKILM